MISDGIFHLQAWVRCGCVVLEGVARVAGTVRGDVDATPRLCRADMLVTLCIQTRFSRWTGRTGAMAGACAAWPHGLLAVTSPWRGARQFRCRFLMHSKPQHPNVFHSDKSPEIPIPAIGGRQSVQFKELVGWRDAAKWQIQLHHTRATRQGGASHPRRARLQGHLGENRTSYQLRFKR